MAGLYGEIDNSLERTLRSAAFPQTGWAGFHYNSSLPRDALKTVLIEAARNGIRAVGILPNMLDLFAEIDAIAPISDQRWVLGYSMIIGPAFLLFADILGRIVLPNGEMRVGIVTALLGAPILIMLVRRKRVSGL